MMEEGRSIIVICRQYEKEDTYIQYNDVTGRSASRDSGNGAICTDRC